MKKILIIALIFIPILLLSFEVHKSSCDFIVINNSIYSIDDGIIETDKSFINGGIVTVEWVTLDFLSGRHKTLKETIKE